jgi:hypothetical protein
VRVVTPLRNFAYSQWVNALSSALQFAQFLG